MQLTLLFGNDAKVLNIPEDSDCNLLYEMVASEFTKEVNTIQLQFNGNIFMKDSKKLSVVGISENDMIIVTTKSEERLSVRNLRPDLKPEEYIQLVKDHPYLQMQFENVDPELGALIKSEDVAKMRQLIMKRVMNEHKMGYEQKKEQQKLWSNPDNEENQKIIAEKIRMQNVDENMHTAMENLPEAFGRVVMLYVDIEINGHKVKAFVDSGAQSTIMSERCAERCGIMRLVDKRFAGEARGVGRAKILGRVHIAMMKAGNSYFPVSITILQQDDVDFLWGLDMLKRYRCKIDLESNSLRVNADGTEENIPFLLEKDMPDTARGTQLAELQNNGNGFPLPAPPPAASTSTSASASASSSTPSALPSSSNVVDVTTSTTSSTTTTTSTTPMDTEGAPVSSEVATITGTTSGSTTASITNNNSMNIDNTNIAGSSSSNNSSSSIGDMEKVQHLMGMGFPEAAVRAALAQAEGNVELAAQLLLAMSN